MRHNEDHRTQNNTKPLNVFIRGTLFSRKLNVVRLPSPPRKQSPVPSLSAARSKKRTNQLHHTWSRLFQNLFHVVYRHVSVEKSLHPIITIYPDPVTPRSRWLGVMNSSHDAAHDARVSHHQHPPPPPPPGGHKLSINAAAVQKYIPAVEGDISAPDLVVVPCRQRKKLVSTRSAQRFNRDVSGPVR